MDVRVRVRRARRDDLDRVRSLLGASAPASLAERKRWRHLVSTLREDLYLAEREDDDTLLGLVVIVYVRGLGPPVAIVRSLHGASDAVTRSLLDCAHRRALSHGCARLEVQLSEESRDSVLATTLLGSGWQTGPRTLVRALSTT
jgi:hypothetical protein